MSSCKALVEGFIGGWYGWMSPIVSCKYADQQSNSDLVSLGRECASTPQ